MSNLAHQIQESVRKEKQSQPRVKGNVAQKKGITLGEKVLVSLFAVVFAVACVFIVSNYASVYSLNRDIQEMQAKVENQEKVNGELGLKVSDLSNPERIWSIAKKNGLTLNGDNVRVLQ